MTISKENDTEGSIKSRALNNLSVGSYLLNKLHSLGVNHIFGLPGDYVLKLDKMIEEHPIQYINTTREATAGYLADAYAKQKGLGVACITYGVGINIVNAVSQAYVESSPLIVISGAPGASEIQRNPRLHHLFNKPGMGPMDTTQLEIFRHITEDQVILTHPETAVKEIDRVIHTCLKKKKPVYIEIPRDVVECPIPEGGLVFPTEVSDPDSLQEAMIEVGDLLKNCKQPIIWAGHEIQRFGMQKELLEFAEKFHIPIVSTLLGKGTVSERHPLFCGVYMGGMSIPEIEQYVDSCDCSIVLGVALNDVNTGFFSDQIEKDFRIFATAEQTKIRHHIYPEILFQDFMRGLANLDLNLRYKNGYPSCLDRENRRFEAHGETKVTTERVFACLQKHLKSEHIIVPDIGDCLLGSADLIVEKDGYLTNAYFCSLGFAVPGAVGAQIANPKKRSIAIVGDGAFQMSCMELSTAVRYGLDPIVIVMNNHGYGTERPIIEGEYNDIQNWNYTEITKVLGTGVGIRVETEEQLEEAIVEAVNRRGEVFVIEVELGKTDFSAALQRFNKMLEASRD